MPKHKRLDPAELLPQLEAAAAATALVRVARRGLEPSGAVSTGYLVGQGERFILLHLMNDDLDLDGYQALRIKHITRFETDFARRPFYEKVLAMKQQAAAKPEGIDLDAASSLLRSVDERFPLITVHRERLYPEECEVGRIRALFRRTYLLHWMTPEATWEVDDRRARYADVTRVEFDRRYENTLALVSGAKPGMVLPERDAAAVEGEAEAVPETLAEG